MGRIQRRGLFHAASGIFTMSTYGIAPSGKRSIKLPLAYHAAADKASRYEGMAFLADAFHVGDTTK